MASGLTPRLLSALLHGFQAAANALTPSAAMCACQVADGLYLGSDVVARSRDTLRAAGITHVINCVGFLYPAYFQDELTYLVLYLQGVPCLLPPAYCAHACRSFIGRVYQTRMCSQKGMLRLHAQAKGAADVTGCACRHAHGGHRGSAV